MVLGVPDLLRDKLDVAEAPGARDGTTKGPDGVRPYLKINKKERKIHTC